MFESIFGRSIAPRQAAIVGAGVLVMALVLGMSYWGVSPSTVPLFADVPVEAMSHITAKLTELAIPYELNEQGTAISVGTENQARARVELANEGLPNAGRPGMELFDKNAWGMTDFTQKVNYGRALEGELERTIRKMRDVDQVQVHLALEDEALFKQNERPSKASVTIQMKSGDIPAQSVVRGIASLVAGSVGGLDPQHVTIIDERGHALASDDDGSVAGLTSRQLTVQREVEASLEKKAETLLGSLVGAGNSQVQVTASINFDKVERTVQEVNPDKQASTSEQRAEVTPSTPAQGAGYSTTATSYENSRSVENFVGAIGTLRKMTVAVLVNDKVTIPAADSVTKVAAAPIFTARSPEEVARIEALMRNALGVDSARGDLISVVSAPFDIPAAEAPREALPKQNLLTRLQMNPKPFVAIAASIVLLILAIVMVIALRPRKEQAPAAIAALAAAPAHPELPSSTQMSAGLRQHQLDGEQGAQGEYIEPAARQVILPAVAVSPEREQAIATVEQRPDAALRVTRAWIRA